LEVWIITIVESLLILAYCIYLLHIYAAKDRTPLYVKILTVIGWLSGYLIILLIPLDIYIYKTYGEVDPFLIVVWYIMYWASFFLNWIIIPFLMEYLASGDFTTKEKIVRSIKNNIPMFILYLVLFIIVVIILAVTPSGREALENEGIVGCVIGLSLVFGLLSIVILLGHGIIQIPISYLKYASNRKKLRYLQYKAAEYDSKQRDKLSKV